LHAMKDRAAPKGLATKTTARTKLRKSDPSEKRNESMKTKCSLS
jgi:hypothetical protein